MDSEGAAGHHLPRVVPHGVIALVRLRHPLGHPDLPAAQQPSPASIAGLGVRPVPEHNWHGLRWSSARGKLQLGAIFRDVVLEVLPVVPVVGLNAFWSRKNE